MRRELSSALLMCMVYIVDLADHGLFLIQICSVGARRVDYTPWSQVKKILRDNRVISWPGLIDLGSDLTSWQYGAAELHEKHENPNRQPGGIVRASL